MGRGSRIQAWQRAGNRVLQGVLALLFVSEYHVIRSLTNCYRLGQSKGMIYPTHILSGYSSHSFGLTDCANTLSYPS